MLGTPKWIYQKYPRNMIEHWIQDWNAIDFLLIIFTWHPNCKAFLIWSCQFAPASITLDAAFIWHPSNWFSISGTIVLISSTLEVFYNFAPEQLPFCLPAISFQRVFAAELRGCIAVGSTCDNGRLLEAKKALKQFKVANLWQDMRNMMGCLACLFGMCIPKEQRKYCSSATLFFQMSWYMAHWRRNLELKVSEVRDWKSFSSVLRTLAKHSCYLQWSFHLFLTAATFAS